MVILEQVYVVILEGRSVESTMEVTSVHLFVSVWTVPEKDRTKLSEVAPGQYSPSTPVILTMIIRVTSFSLR